MGLPGWNGGARSRANSSFPERYGSRGARGYENSPKRLTPDVAPVVFAVVLVAFFVLRIVVATVVFFFILPDGDRCPICDEVTLRVQSRGWNTLMPWFRTSWCIRCNWEGLHRHGPAIPAAASAIERAAEPASRRH